MNMDRPTEDEKREFISRCKELALRKGRRSNYRPARFELAIWPDLLINWGPDQEHLNVRVQLEGRNPENETWSLVVASYRNDIRWGCLLKLREHLRLMRQEMVLDDLADI